MGLTASSPELLHLHLSFNREGRLSITDDFTTSFLHFSPVLYCPLGLGEHQACPFPDVVFPPLLLSNAASDKIHWVVFVCLFVFQYRK